jgi:tetratricopeptide (TPR) repeat protein
MGLYDLVYGMAAYLHQQGETSLWQMLQRDPDWAQRPTSLIDHLVERLDRKPYLLCFDDFQNVGADPSICLLFETAEKRWSKQSSRVILVSRNQPNIPMIGSCELAPISRKKIEELVVKLKVYQKDWLDQAVAQRFAGRLLGLLGPNLALINIVAIEWFRNNTSLSDAEAYLDAPDSGRVAEMILERRDPLQAGLLCLLTVLEEGASSATLLELVRAPGGHREAARPVEPAGVRPISQEEVVYALDVLKEARLVYVDQGRYHLHESVREICHSRLTEQKERLLDLHRRAGDLFLAECKKPAGAGSSCLQAARHYLQAEAYEAMIQVLFDHAVDLITAGQASPARMLLEQAERELEGYQDWPDAQRWLWIYILKSDLDAWLGRLPAAQAAAEVGLEEWGEGGKFPYEEARLRARLGSILGKMHRLDEAIGQLLAGRSAAASRIRTARSAAEKIRCKYVLLHILDTLGLAYYVQGLPQRAITQLEELLKQARAMSGFPRVVFFVARAQVRLAQIYNDLGKTVEALEQAQAGLEAFERIDLQWGAAFARAELGRIHFKQGAYEQARTWYQRSLDSARELDDSEIMVNCHLVLGEIALLHPDATGKRDLEGAAGHFDAVRRVMVGKPEREQAEGESAGAVQLPPPLEGFFTACRLWIEGLERLLAGDAEGAARLEQARETLCQFGFADDAALVGV